MSRTGGKDWASAAIERVLCRLLSADLAESLVGDLAEELESTAANWGRWRTLTWVGRQILSSAPALLRRELSLRWAGRTVTPERQSVPAVQTPWRGMDMNGYRRQNTRLFALGVILVLPAMLIVVPGLLQSGLNSLAAGDSVDALLDRLPVLDILIHPAVILGGLLLAFLINARQVFDLHMEREPERMVWRVGVNLHPLHFGFVLFTLAVVGVIFLYLLVENFSPM